MINEIISIILTIINKNTLLNSLYRKKHLTYDKNSIKGVISISPSKKLFLYFISPETNDVIAIAVLNNTTFTYHLTKDNYAKIQSGLPEFSQDATRSSVEKDIKTIYELCLKHQNFSASKNKNSKTSKKDILVILKYTLEKLYRLQEFENNNNFSLQNKPIIFPKR